MLSTILHGISVRRGEQSKGGYLVRVSGITVAENSGTYEINDELHLTPPPSPPGVVSILRRIDFEAGSRPVWGQS